MPIVRNSVLCFVGVLMASSASAEEFFRYATGVVPPTSATCEQEAAAFGARFAAATGLSVYASSCAEDGFSGRKLELTYIAERAVQVVSAMRGRFWDADEDDTMPAQIFDLGALFGRYDQYATCFSAAAAEVARFESETGLDAVAAYCEPGTAGGISLRIDGFGTPLRRYRQQDVEFRGEVDVETAERLAAVFADNGASIIEGEPWGPHALISYYGAFLGISMFSPNYYGQVDDVSQCSQELQVAQEALSSMRGGQPLIATCLQASGSGGFHLNFAFLREGSGLGFGEVRGPTFSSFSACSADRARGVEAIRRISGRDVRAGVCVRDRYDDSSAFVLIGLAP